MMYKCAPEQLIRQVSQEQETLIRMLPSELVALKRNIQGRGAGNYVDLSGEGYPPGGEHGQGDDDLGEERRGSQVLRETGANRPSGR